MKKLMAADLFAGAGGTSIRPTGSGCLISTKAGIEYWRTCTRLRATMPKTPIDGTCACHAIITDECRANRGNIGALTEACRRLLAQYRQATDEKTGFKVGSGAKFHVVLTVERPERPNGEHPDCHYHP